MLTEKQIENKIKRLLAEQGAYFFKHFGCKFSIAGVPDIVGCFRGQFFGIEVKRADGKLSELQKIHIERIKKAGGIGLVARSVEEVEECLHSMSTKRIT